ncbi:expressed unknown protein [Seminavis robusta]|uniref:NAD(P)-binding domain-containing protein n=1 Tax=Seminavis robusta TaxID=568900 RepID=A0A9N8DQG0_9STRA|nr:expressed unknown protein [Seminavis robusta]|eukprot:Sro281_g107240.1 n/a (317) ;mRNA; r:26461-27411
MKSAIIICQLASICLLSRAAAFAPAATTYSVHSSRPSCSLAAKDGNNNDDFISTVASALDGVVSGVTGLFPTTLLAASNNNNKGNKVLVLGGTGFVGSRVVQQLESLGVTVVATSTDGRDGTVALDFTQQDPTAMQQTVQKLAKGSVAVVSCIGAIGTDNDKAINAGTGYAVQAAKKAGVDRFVYISVAPEVKEFAQDFDFLKDYLEGKSFSQDTIESTASLYTIIQPTFIHGGDEFKINPPRVAGFYGSFVEAVLSSGPLRALMNVAPEGFIKIALKPPVSVDAVAQAAVAGALGEVDDKFLDTYDKIKETAALL